MLKRNIKELEFLIKMDNIDIDNCYASIDTFRKRIDARKTMLENLLSLQKEDDERATNGANKN